MKLNKLKNGYEIRVDDEIGGFGIDPNMFEETLKACNGEDITLNFFSPGGSILAGTAMCNALANYKGKKTAYIQFAASMASIMAMYCDKIVISSMGFFVIHNPFISVTGDAEELRNNAEVLDKMKENAIQAYKKHTKLNDKELEEMMNKTTWIGSTDAIAYGFADEISDKISADCDEDEDEDMPVMPKTQINYMEMKQMDMKQIVETFKNLIKPEVKEVPEAKEEVKVEEVKQEVKEEVKDEVKTEVPQMYTKEMLVQKCDDAYKDGLHEGKLMALEAERAEMKKVVTEIEGKLKEVFTANEKLVRENAELKEQISKLTPALAIETKQVKRTILEHLEEIKKECPSMRFEDQYVKAMERAK